MRFLVMALVLSMATAAAACPRHGVRANVRACFANQKILAGALEMWNLDKNCRVEEHLDRGEDPLAALPHVPNPTGACSAKHGMATAGAPRVWFLPPALLEQLKREGYLQSVPRDPGQGDAPNYALASFGNGVVCLFHGDIEGNGLKPARKRLYELGVTDPDVLTRASTENPRREPWRPEDLLPFTIMMFPLAFAVTFLRLVRDRAYSASERLGTAIRWIGLALFCLIPAALMDLEVGPFALATWEVGAAGAAILVGTARAIASLWSDEPEAVRPRGRHPLPLLASRGLKCAVCGCTDGPALWVTCPECDAAHHGECWTFQDGCAAFGCSMAHGRWRSGAAPVRTVAPGEPEKGAVHWL